MFPEEFGTMPYTIIRCVDTQENGYDMEKEACNNEDEERGTFYSSGVPSWTAAAHDQVVVF
jgi:hypothetical protein